MIASRANPGREVNVILTLLLACPSDPLPPPPDAECQCPTDTATPDSGDTGDTFEPVRVASGDEFASIDGLTSQPGHRGALVGVGDVTGDGLDDLWVGAPAYGPEKSAGTGAALLFAGAVSGDLTESAAHMLFEGVADQGRLGTRVGGGGDLDGDGVPDLWVSAPDAAGQAGVVYVLSGATTPAGRSTVDEVELTITGQEGGRTGYHRSEGHGDVDGDGIDDLLLSSMYETETKATPWWLVQGPITAAMDIQDATSVRRELIDEDGLPDTATAGVVADLDGDGYAEVIIGDRASLMGAGRVLVYEGEEGGLGSVAALVIGAESSDAITLEGAMASAGDVDGDGTADLLLGAARADVSATDSGAAWLLFGPLEGVYSLAAHGVRLAGVEEAGVAGYWVSSAGDTSGDGLDEVLVGGSGKAWIVEDPVSDVSLERAEVQLEGSVAYPTGVGDLNADGRDDIATVGSDEVYLFGGW